MNEQMLVYSGFLLFGTFISSVSQVLLKKSANRGHDSLIREYLNPRVIGSYSLFIFATLLAILSYRVVPLSFGPVLESTSYIYVTIFGVTLFGEKITFKKMLALVLIVCGIAISSVGI